MADSRRLTIMMQACDIARADMALTPDRIYYRFYTEESIEDGELPPSKENFDDLSRRILSAAVASEGEKALSSDIKVTIFIENRLADIQVSEESLRRLIDELRYTADEFSFLGGFSEP